MGLARTLGTSVILAAALGGCAPSKEASGEDRDGSALDAQTEASAPAVTAPAAIGVSLFSDACDGGAPAVDWSPVRRISRVEYDNMVRDLLGDTTKPATAFPPESPLTGGVNFQANTYEGVSTLIVQDYAQAAETLAQTAVSTPATLAKILPCQTQDDACARQFIDSWANLAFRGQLDASVESSLFQLYSDASAQFDFTTGIQAVIMAVLESPRFLYVFEFGAPAASDAG